MSAKHTSKTDVLIFGAGLSGLALAYFLQQLDEKLSITIIEKSNRVGGKICTQKVQLASGEELLLELGPDSFMTAKPALVNLATELGLSAEFISPQAKTFYILRNKILRIYPSGMSSILPTKFFPFAFSSLLSLACKIRIAGEPFIKRRKCRTDESVGSFIRRRLGARALDYLGEPLLSGIYGADPEKHSMNACFPQLVALEQKHSSLLKAAWFLRKSKKNITPFLSFKNGLQTIVDAVHRRLTCRIEVNAHIEKIEQDLDDKSITVHLESAKKVTSQAIVFTAIAGKNRELFNSLCPDAADLKLLRSMSTGCVYLAFESSALKLLPNISGILIPKKEACRINAITFVSNKYAERCPPHLTLLRVFFGSSRAPMMVDLSDLELIAIAQEELRLMMGITQKAVFAKVWRMRDAQPQYDLNHLEWANAMNAACEPGVFLTGSHFYGSGLPDCVSQAQQKAQEIIAYLKKESAK